MSWIVAWIPTSTSVSHLGYLRPQIRRSVVLGSNIVFLGYCDKDQRYLVKGWMRVGEKINYLNALERFRDRPNVIVRELTGHQARQPKSFAAVRWKRKPLQQQTLHRYGADSPRFLTTIHHEDRVYVQIDEDSHEFDNWRCQRICLCQATQLKRRIMAGVYLREPEFPRLTGYVVAVEDGWQDVGPLRVDWRAVAPPSLRDRSLRTPCGWHNALWLSDAEVMEIVGVLWNWRSSSVHNCRPAHSHQHDVYCDMMKLGKQAPMKDARPTILP